MGRTSTARERLLAAALELISSRGFASVSIDDLCATAGVTKGSFYHFFAGKAELAAAALLASFEDRRPGLDRCFSATEPPLSRLQRFFCEAHRIQQTGFESTGFVQGCPYLSVGCEVSQSPGPVRDASQQILAHYTSYFESGLRDAAAAGLVHPEEIPERAAAILCLFEGTLAQARIRNDPALVSRLWQNSLPLLRLTQRGEAALSSHPPD